MRLWPSRRAGDASVAAAPSDSLLLLEERLRLSMQDLFLARGRQAQGYTLRWSGELLEPPARALGLLEARFKPYGYTPFLKRDKGTTWVQAIPLAIVSERSRPLINLVLFLLTLLSTIAAGCFVATGAVPFLTFNPLRSPGVLLEGLPFAVTLVAILGTHEFGHYFTARAYGASVSLPYFIPAPPPLFLFGTLGAVIRMRSPARDRNALFDIAVAGPLAGLVVAVPALWLGLTWSHLGQVPDGGGVTFGDSLLMHFMNYLIFGNVPPGMDVIVHPVALAGWVGLFVTALNLFPVGQLDGGRIAYALVGPAHRFVSIGTFFGLLALGAVAESLNWIVFAGLVFVLIGFRHAPPLDDLTPLSRERYAVGVFCLLLLILLIPPVPIALPGP
jgi:membrane-associated protease RseP (regulator of RpoE activity)